MGGLPPRHSDVLGLTSDKIGLIGILKSSPGVSTVLSDLGAMPKLFEKQNECLSEFMLRLWDPWYLTRIKWTERF